MRALRGKVAPDLYAKVQSIQASILRTLDMEAVPGDGADPNVYLIRQTALAYLPDAFSTYLRMPRAVAERRAIADGRTPHDVLLDQLDLMDRRLADVADDMARHDSDKLLANGRFLAENNLESRIGDICADASLDLRRKSARIRALFLAGRIAAGSGLGQDILGRLPQAETYAVSGAFEALAHFKGQGIPLAVCTNKPDDAAREVLGSLGLAPYFSEIIGGTSGLARKPDPATLLEAARRLGAEPNRTLMVGDSLPDVSAARAAGMKVLVVDSGYGEIAAADLGADAVLTGLGELALPAAAAPISDS